MKKRLRLVVCVAVASVVAGCGGGGKDQAEIEAAIEAMALAGKPSKCTEAMTATAREQLVHDPEPTALKACEAEAGAAAEHAKSVSVSNVEVKGEKATADVGFADGGFGGQVLTFSLRQVDGKWKVDQIVHYARLDAAALGRAFKRQSEEHNVLPPALARCVQGRIEKASKKEIEELTLTPVPTAESAHLVESCIR